MDDQIQKGLRKIRRAKLTEILLFIAFILVGFLSILVSERYHINFLFIIGPYGLFVLACDAYLGLTATCPKCKELYYWRMSGIGYRNFFTKKCLNCGLELNEMAVPVKEKEVC